MRKEDHEKVQNLLESLSDEDSIQWDNDGTVYLDGQKLDGSNLGLLISAIFHEPPIGLDAFRDKLKALNLI